MHRDAVQFVLFLLFLNQFLVILKKLLKPIFESVFGQFWNFGKINYSAGFDFLKCPGNLTQLRCLEPKCSSPSCRPLGKGEAWKGWGMKIEKKFGFGWGVKAPPDPSLNGCSSYLIEAAKRGCLDQMIFFSARAAWTSGRTSGRTPGGTSSRTSSQTSGRTPGPTPHLWCASPFLNGRVAKQFVKIFFSRTFLFIRHEKKIDFTFRHEFFSDVSKKMFFRKYFSKTLKRKGFWKIFEDGVHWIG